MKAQLTVQYLASFIFFIGLVLYIYFSYSANIPAFIEEVGKEDTRSKAYQLSEILVNDPGDPADWWNHPPDQIRRIGFSDENSNKTNFLSIEKVERFDEICETLGFLFVREKLAIEKPFSVHVFNISQETGERTLIADCIPPFFPVTTINATIKRIFALNNTPASKLELAELIIQM